MPIFPISERNFPFRTLDGFLELQKFKNVTPRRKNLKFLRFSPFWAKYPNRGWTMFFSLTTMAHICKIWWSKVVTTYNAWLFLDGTLSKMIMLWSKIQYAMKSKSDNDNTNKISKSKRWQGKVYKRPQDKSFSEKYYKYIAPKIA